MNMINSRIKIEEMQSDFLDKFKGKTNKVPKQGVLNLIEPSNKNPHNLLPAKVSQGKPHSKEKQAKSKNRKQKNSLSQKQNKEHIILSDSKPKHKKLRSNEKQKNKEPKQTLLLKQNKKPFNGQNNVKKQPLKLPKISKQKTSDSILPVRQIPGQIVRQNRHKTNLTDQRQADKPKKSLLTESRQIKYERSNRKNHTLQSLLDEQALLQLKKLNDFQHIVHEIQIKRRLEIEEQQMMQKSRHYRKGVTVHY